MTRWTFVALGAFLVAGAAAVGLARLTGRSGTRPALAVSVVAQWLGAFVLWNFAGGLAQRYGFLAVYDGTLFGVLALLGGLWHYRTRVRGGREPAVVVFVGAQLAWLAVVLVQNGLLAP